MNWVQAVSDFQMFLQIERGLSENSISNYSNDIKTFHYGNTPYRYKPKSSMKMVPTEYVDFGQGLLDIVEEVCNKK